MKRIYMTLGLIAAAATGAMAQNKAIDLGIRLLNPVDNQTFNNFVVGTDTMKYQLEISNNGTDAVAPTDTLTVILDLAAMGIAPTGSNTKSLLSIGTPPLTIAAGGKDTLYFNVGQGRVFQFTSGNKTVKYPSDSKVCTYATIFGYDQDLGFFNDPGFDGAAYNAATTADQLYAAFSGNNLDNVDNIKFGSGANDLCGGVGIIEFGGGAKEALKVYPNPVMDNLNFDFNLDNAANAVVRITDIAGRTVKTQDLGKVRAGEHKFSINVSNLNTGMYMVEVSADGKRFVSKFNRK
ncbi:T9SS type A sorting domain-containing protein [Taibaiella koreensis]|uniref:T9SS type A sorting domain-containing protein n=1 Tax=Taibaiella koreensis TaxID=1268548 RepID=UPI000E59BA87|nr:T9SS type A sorting domain-containing protein [Taibaiella koreensis]